MKRVSVIIPVYKTEKWLPACLDSVLGQTLREIEVLCIDDASPDGCGRILDEYAAKDPRVRVFHLPENRQQGYGRNLGLSEAVGKYVYFLDADDCITPEALEELAAAAEAEALDAVFFDSQVIYDSPALAGKYSDYPAVRKGPYEDRVYTGPELFEAFSANREWTCYVQRQFWNRAFLNANGIRFPEGTEHEDEWLPFAGILQAGRVRYLPARYFIRRYREDSVMTRPADPKDFHGYFRLFCRMSDYVKEHGIESPAADLNLARIYEKLERFYPQFAAQADPEAWFPDPEERRMYRFFAATRKSGLHAASMTESLRRRLPADRDIWICGAGVIARSVCRGLTEEGTGLVVAGFLVSRHEGNPAVLFGRRVCTFEEVPPGGGRIAVIAVSGGARREIAETLCRFGWDYLQIDEE